MNKVILIGRIGNIPELKQAGQASVCSISLATSEKFRDNAGAVKESTDWHTCIFWNKPAEIIAKYGSKGGLICVEGKIKTREYQDREGRKQFKTEVVVNNFEFLASVRNPESGTAPTEPTVSEQDNNIPNDLPF